MMRHHRADAVIRAVEIDVEHLVPARAVEEHHVRVAHDAGIVHEDVDRSELSRDPFEKCGDRQLVGDIASSGPGPPAACTHRGFHLPRRRFVPVKGDSDARAFGGQ